MTADRRIALAVFVHGLGSDVKRFWGSTIDALDTHFDLAHVKVRAWGYETASKPQPRVVQFVTKQRLQTIEQLGKQLWSELAFWSESEGYDSIVLFGHSMGGLVVAAAVDEGLRVGRDTQLIESIKGVAFCATPFGGAKLASRLRVPFRLLGGNVQVEGLRENSAARKKLAVRFVNRTQAGTVGRHHRRIDLTLFRAADDHIVSEAEMLGPFSQLEDVPVRVLRKGHSTCIQDLGIEPHDPGFEMVVRWIKQRTTPGSVAINTVESPRGNGAKKQQAPIAAAIHDDVSRIQIQVAKANHETHIAYWAMGHGLPLVIPPGGLPFSNVELELENPLTCGWYERLSQFCRPIRYDARGSGKSEVPSTELSLDDLMQDVEAVRKHMGEAKIALLGAFHAGPIAIRYAANFPQHVSHLILWCTYAEASDFWANKEVRALNDVLTTNWHDYTEFVAGTVFGWHDETTRRHMVHFLRHSMEPEAVQKSLSAMEKFDVRADLERISAPTLILHAGRFKFVNRSKATGLAGEITGSELATIEESNGLLLAGAPGAEAAAERMRQFLATTTPAAGVRGLLSRT